MIQHVGGEGGPRVDGQVGVAAGHEGPEASVGLRGVEEGGEVEAEGAGKGG